MDNYFINHIIDLSNQCFSKDRYTFSDFLNEEEINEILKNKKLLTDFTFFGGTHGAQRQMIRFGSEENLHYTEDFPIKCIKAEPLNKKFADVLTHRDFLGAIMSLRVNREQIGDIIIKDNSAFIFVTNKMSEFICENLIKIKHTDIKCSICEFEKTTELFSLEESILITSSLRADCIIGAVYKLSRSTSQELFKSKKVYINSELCESTSKIIKENDKISVRGFGKFIFCTTLSTTKKDRLKISIKKFV